MTNLEKLISVDTGTRGTWTFCCFSVTYGTFTLQAWNRDRQSVAIEAFTIEEGLVKLEQAIMKKEKGTE